MKLNELKSLINEVISESKSHNALDIYCSVLWKELKANKDIPLTVKELVIGYAKKAFSEGYSKGSSEARSLNAPKNGW